MDACTKHPHEHGTGTCRRCGMAWCGDCLVYAYGPNKPPLCIGCAMFAGGVRTSGMRPAMSRKALRSQRKAAKATARAEVRAAKRGGTRSTPAAAAASSGQEETKAVDYGRRVSGHDVSGDSSTDDSDTAGSGIDWSTPWWEESREATLTD